MVCPPLEPNPGCATGYARPAAHLFIAFDQQQLKEFLTAPLKISQALN